MIWSRFHRSTSTVRRAARPPYRRGGPAGPTGWRRRARRPTRRSPEAGTRSGARRRRGRGAAGGASTPPAPPSSPSQPPRRRLPELPPTHAHTVAMQALVGTPCTQPPHARGPGQPNRPSPRLPRDRGGHMRHLHIRDDLARGVATALLGLTLAAAPAGAGLPDRDERTTLPVADDSTGDAPPSSGRTPSSPWSRADGSTAPRRGLARSLEVITADGVRHPVYCVDLVETAAGWYPGDFAIVDWRPELHTALLRVSLGAGRRQAGVVRRDDRRACARWRRHARASTVALAPGRLGRPDDDLPQRHGARAASAAVGWDGVTDVAPARGDGAAITSADGRHWSPATATGGGSPT